MPLRLSISTEVTWPKTDRAFLTRSSVMPCEGLACLRKARREVELDPAVVGFEVEGVFVELLLGETARLAMSWGVGACLAGGCVAAGFLRIVRGAGGGAGFAIVLPSPLPVSDLDGLTRLSRLLRGSFRNGGVEAFAAVGELRSSDSFSDVAGGAEVAAVS
jgi:hypothetical protein